MRGNGGKWRKGEKKFCAKVQRGQKISGRRWLPSPSLSTVGVGWGFLRGAGAPARHVIPPPPPPLWVRGVLLLTPKGSWIHRTGLDALQSDAG